MSYDDSVVIEAPSDSFWEVGNYKRTVKRFDDGHRLCNDLMSCLHDRARIEKSYAAQLTEWAKKWKQMLEKGPQYGTLEKAWLSLMTEAEKVSELHLGVKCALMSEDFEKVKNWQKEAYHKQMMANFKETKEADDGFRKAQKPWAKKLKEVEAAKKAYHLACKEEKIAISRESNSKADSNVNPEQLKKVQDKVEKSKQDVQKTKEKYEKNLDELNKSTPQYIENMEQVFEQCQLFENKRLEFFREVLLEVKQHLDLSATSYSNVYQELEHTIKSADPKEDLKWFRCTHGPGMPMNWPQFEEWCADLNRTLSRREKPKKTGDGVTLTSISQTGEQASQPPTYNSYEKNQNDTTEWSDDETNNPFNSNETNGDNPFDEDHSGSEVKVRALYDYEGQEHDELSFKAGDELTKVEDEDEQGWCKGRLENGQVGLYPANYVELIP
ncbi:protein kinase C and casein kinase substrate in neurons protein 2-like isoform X8 [Scyliorhinus canicula]|uniref:protein kinase C and casein kinase substrate in neurons protein 2-like isoform X8 n=1 Tax=Scyliorhinus canicula TaxID=7830 RepID=UPI0018F6B71B|nr:protein kinase C and casein kinase substrate in neurons protein 2-like isoform X8 [Scyliorhinus canicula]